MAAIGGARGMIAGGHACNAPTIFLLLQFPGIHCEPEFAHSHSLALTIGRNTPPVLAFGTEKTKNKYFCVELKELQKTRNTFFSRILIIGFFYSMSFSVK